MDALGPMKSSALGRRASGGGYPYAKNVPSPPATCRRKIFHIARTFPASGWGRGLGWAPENSRYVLMQIFCQPSCHSDGAGTETCFGRRLKDLSLRLIAAYCKQEILRCAQDDVWNNNRSIPGTCFLEKNAYFRRPRVRVRGLNVRWQDSVFQGSWKIALRS